MFLVSLQKQSRGGRNGEERRNGKKRETGDGFVTYEARDRGGGGGKHYIQKPVEELRRSRLWATTGLE